MGAMPREEYTNSSFTLNPVPETVKNHNQKENFHKKKAVKEIQS